MSGWTVVDANTNKSQPITGKNDSGAVAPYFNAAPGAQDPVGKMRVSEPQALIDTDFEYGQQPTKWESISLQNNRQSAYYIPQQPLVVTGITGNGTTTVTITGTFVVPAASLIYVQNAIDSNANGWWYTAAGGTNTMTVVTTSVVASGAQFNAALTYVYRGYFYSSSGVLVGANAFSTDGSTGVVCTTTGPHGLSAGSLVYIVNTTSSGTSINGAQVVTATTNANTFTFTNTNGAVAAAAITNGLSQNVVYARPAGYVESRSFDGGVAFSAGAAVPNSQMIRQTRRYFRYQSGKGLQFSTGTSMCPPIFTTGVTSSGTTATVTTRFAHNLAVGATIQVTGAEQGTYNGTFTIATVPTPTTFTYVMGGTPSVSPATGLLIKVSAVNWFGSSNRVGFMDQQNGLFFEYDGQMLYAVWRNSINQINGTVSVVQSSGTVTGTGTQFSAQLKPGDFTVIRGQTYRVVSIASDTTMYISPEYRGATIAGALLSKTIDIRVPRTQWADPLDGTGPSGYTLDITRMQMWYIDYSWYGAGFIRWGLRTSKGQISYVHQQFNNNLRFEAYMRSGNLAAHYESNGVTPVTSLTSSLGTGGAGTIINVESTDGFAPTGTLRIQASGVSGAVEHISYTNRTASTFTVVARGLTGGQGAATGFTYSATAPVQVEYASPDTNASLSHWGSSVIMDGRYDDDKSLIFNYGTTAAITTTNTNPIVIMAIRLAPSVDNGTTGLLGIKEIINRSQLQLSSLGLYTTGTGYLINLILNGFASGAMSTGFVAPIQQANGITSSLSQIATNTNAVTVTGGESVFAAYSNTSGNTTLDLSIVRDLGNSILGGGTSNTVPTSQAGFYPDGPDILYIVATPLTATSSTIVARLNWKEAQA
jgi:hypothetical protein